MEIDGSLGEGGGSILRLSAALGIIFKKKIHVFNIRANRKVPGLRAQHVMGLKALETLSNGKLEGAKVRSTEITFEPGKIRPGQIDIHVSTAGSIGLIFQTLSIACARASLSAGEKVTVNINGGATVGKWAPAYSYIINVLIPLLGRMGFKARLNVIKHGFYPKGGAKASITFEISRELKGLELSSRGNIIGVHGESIAAKSLERARVANRQADAFKKRVSRELSNIKIEVKAMHVPTLNPGSGITTWMKTSTGCVLSSGSIVGEKGLSSEKIGNMAAKSLLSLVKEKPLATVDVNTSDQLIPFMALSNEKSVMIAPDLTNHAKTNIEIIKMFTTRPIFTRWEDEHCVIEFPRVE
ncbi:MAG: RNA 3'-terminal phosphate cyclase [Promethearchaeota archaeon]